MLSIMNTDGARVSRKDTGMELKLGDIQTTALIPLVMKASETLRKDPRIRDEKAVEIVKALGIDTKQYDKFLSHEGVIARTIMLDRQLSEIIRKHPDSVIINIGAGFDSRFSRLDNGSILWFDLDLPDAIEVRKKSFPEQDRVTMIACDVLDPSWCEPVKKALEERDAKPVFIAEGLFMYLTFDQIRSLLSILRDNFTEGGTLIAEQNSKLLIKNEKHHDAVRSTDAKFVSGSDNAQEIADLTEGIRVVEEHSFNEEMKKYSIRGKLFALLVPKVNDRWATVEWDEADSKNGGTGSEGKYDLGIVEDTLYVPMLGRIYASENCRSILYDAKALSLKDKLPEGLIENDKQTQYTLLASASRSANMDRFIREFTERRPDGIVVQLGVGLETSFYRNDNENTPWYGIDLPHVIEYRRSLIPEHEREKYIGGDAFSEDWIRQIRSEHPDAPILVTASGLFYYFEEETVLGLMKMLQSFGDIELIFDTVSKSGMTMMRKKHMKTVGHEDAKMFFYVDSADDLVKKVGGEARVLAEENFYCRIPKAGLQFSTKASMIISDRLSMVKMIHLQI